jgi:uncharacterized membrane protein
VDHYSQDYQNIHCHQIHRFPFVQLIFGVAFIQMIFGVVVLLRLLVIQANFFVLFLVRWVEKPFLHH